jgi:hypothetical protein
MLSQQTERGRRAPLWAVRRADILVDQDWTCNSIQMPVLIHTGIWMSDRHPDLLIKTIKTTHRARSTDTKGSTAYDAARRTEF